MRGYIRATGLLAAGLIVFGAAGCREREGEGVRTTVYDKAEQAARSAPEQRLLTPPQREESLDIAQGRLEAAEEELQRLLATAEGAAEGVRGEIAGELEQLRRQMEEARLKVRQLRETGAEAWPQVHAEAQQALEALEAGIRRVSARLGTPGGTGGSER